MGGILIHEWKEKELYVNLTTGEIKKETLDPELLIKFLGGMGVQLRRLYDLLKPGIDPFSPENPIIIGSGPLVGTGAPGTPRVLATLKYPETGAIGCGGGAMRFGFMLRMAGYAHIVIVGKADKPVYLKVVDDDIEICDASYLWGRDLFETTERLWEKYGDCGVIAIGQAGENMGVITLAMCDNAATLGRGGLGGVMGSKNLKALVAKGSGSIKIADIDRFKRVRDSLFERCRRYPYHADIVKYGVMTNFPNYGVQMGYTRSRTQMLDYDELNRKLGFEAYKKSVKRKAIGCPSCFIADKEILEVLEGRFKGLRTSTPSYLNAAIAGGVLDLKDCGEAIKFLDTCDRYGLDQISFLDILDFLITLYEEGKIKAEDVDSLPLERGNIDAICVCAEKTAFRQDFGGVIADGWKGIMRKFSNNKEVMDFIKRNIPLIKGRTGVWDPRISGLGTNEFAQLVYPRGPNAESGGTGLYTLNQPVETVKRHADRMGMPKDRIEKAFDSPLKINIGRLTVSSEHWLALFNSLGICNRHVNNRFYHISIVAELYSAVTGIDVTPQELVKRAERVWNLFKMINVREGFWRIHDEPPDQWFEPIKTPDGQLKYMTDYYNVKKLTRRDIEQWLDDYYDERGWDIKTGLPTREKLKECGLEELIPDLEQALLKISSSQGGV